MIGNARLQLLRRRRARFSILIGEAEHRGSGQGREATALLCRYAFDRLGVERDHRSRSIRATCPPIRAYQRGRLPARPRPDDAAQAGIAMRSGSTHAARACAAREQLRRVVPPGEARFEQPLLSGEELGERRRRPPLRDVRDQPHPEEGQRAVVPLRHPVRRGQVAQAPLDLGRRRVQAVAADQDPGEAEVLAMAEDAALGMAGVERVEERRVGGRGSCCLGAALDRLVGARAGPEYSERGRIRRLLACCSMTWAAQPATRLIAKIGVKRSVAMPDVVVGRGRVEVDVRVELLLARPRSSRWPRTSRTSAAPTDSSASWREKRFRILARGSPVL